MNPTERVHVGLGGRSYDILIGEGLLSRTGALMAPVLPAPRAVILSDDRVAPLYAETVLESLAASGIACLKPFVIPHGEASKSFAMLERTAGELLKTGVDRSTTLIALGGGVVGDLAGFLAAVLMRGLGFIQIPTTLLAQVDSSVGGKTGINMPQGKNLVGAFWQPKMVIIDTRTLATLPQRERLAGYAETVKYGLINDLAFFEWLRTNGTELLAGHAPSQIKAIATACRAKAGIVERDENETGDIRALLNLGHSFGHALETMGGHDGSLLHGEAVAIGMSMAFAFSAEIGLCRAEDAVQVKRHLSSAGLPVACPGGVDAVRMLDCMKRDKKALNEQIKLVLARGIGQAFVATGIDENALLDFIENYKNGDL